MFSARLAWLRRTGQGWLGPAQPADTPWEGLRRPQRVNATAAAKYTATTTILRYSDFKAPGGQKRCICILVVLRPPHLRTKSCQNLECHSPPC